VQSGNVRLSVLETATLTFLASLRSLRLAMAELLVRYAHPFCCRPVEAFRAYVAHTRTDEFRAATTNLLVVVSGHPDAATAVRCSESLWWRCHRRLIADVAVLLHRVPVQHLGRITPEGLRYDSPGPSL
jgi:uncharacterized protein (DUF488 family)